MIPPPPPSDAALLRAYTEAGASDAFRQVVEKHTPLVFGTCQRVLGHTDGVEDAFVALALKAGRIDAGRMAARRRPAGLSRPAQGGRVAAGEGTGSVAEGRGVGAGEGRDTSGLDEVIDALPANCAGP